MFAKTFSEKLRERLGFLAGVASNLASVESWVSLADRGIVEVLSAWPGNGNEGSSWTGVETVPGRVEPSDILWILS